MAPDPSDQPAPVLAANVSKSRTQSPAVRLRTPAKPEEVHKDAHKDGTGEAAATDEASEKVLLGNEPLLGANGAQAETAEQSGISKAFGKLLSVKHFWFGKKFQVHRVMGLTYLLQYTWAMFLYLTDYESFRKSPVTITLPICGFLQAVIAACTFRFLPRKKEAGYVAFGDVGALSYNYVLENTFFSMLLCFQWLYYDDRLFKPFFRKTQVFELLFVFMPYMPFIRPMWPVSSFRDSTKDPKGVTKENKYWFNRSILITKCFYIFAKHYTGFFSNYMRYVDKIGPEEQRVNHGLLLGGCYGTTIAMFIHTLRFKGYISAKTGALVYQVSFPWMIYFWGRLLYMCSSHLDIVAITTVGMLLNNSVMTTRRCPTWHIYQVLVMIGMSRGVLHNLW